MTTAALRLHDGTMLDLGDAATNDLHRLRDALDDDSSEEVALRIDDAEVVIDPAQVDWFAYTVE